MVVPWVSTLKPIDMDSKLELRTKANHMLYQIYRIKWRIANPKAWNKVVSFLIRSVKIKQYLPRNNLKEGKTQRTIPQSENARTKIKCMRPSRTVADRRLGSLDLFRHSSTIETPKDGSRT